jgi:hypothetical protein
MHCWSATIATIERGISDNHTDSSLAPTFALYQFDCLEITTVAEKAGRGGLIRFRTALYDLVLTALRTASRVQRL